MTDVGVLVNGRDLKFLGVLKAVPVAAQTIYNGTTFFYTNNDDGEAHFDAELLASILDNTRNEQVISILKKANISNETDSSGNTLLHIAAQYDNNVITQHLVRSGCKIDVQNRSGKTPLILAIENRRHNSIGILLEANANTLISDDEGKSALHYFLVAHWFNVSYLVWKFLKNVEIQCLNDSEVIATKFIEAGWPLPCVKLLENTEVIAKMLDLGCQVNAREPVAHRTALHEAVLSSDVKMVKLLLDNGADPNIMDRFHRTPLHYVYDREKQDLEERVEIVNLLFGKGALTVTTTDDIVWSQVNPALRYGNGEVIRILLQNNLDLDGRHECDSTPVHILATNIKPDAFKTLENQNFDVDARTTFLQTPLWSAAAYGNACAVKILLEKGADVHAVNMDDCSPLHKCIERFLPEFEDRYKECVQLLLEYGAHVQKESYSFREQPSTVFDVVRERELHVLGDLLIAHLVLQESQGKIIDEFISRHHIQSYSAFKNYYDFCERKLAVKLYKSVTLLDLLSASDVKFESYVRDQQCASSIENFNNEWHSKLYYYNTILQKRYSKAVRMLKLRKEAAIHMCEIMKTDYFQYPSIADQIVNYLYESDLENLLKVVL